jgi:RNA polymerase sigma-70 factor (ECF subfamily)
MNSTTFDEDYVSRLTDGDPDVERHFTSYFGDLLHIKLRSRLRSRQHIDDVRQETLLRVLIALRHKRGLARPDRLGAFVHAICNNVLHELFRAQTRTVPMPQGAPEWPDEIPSIESELITWERRGAVRRVLSELAEKDRLLLEEAFFLETPKDEICRKLQVDRGYLRVLLHRAKTRFRELLEQSRIFNELSEQRNEHLSRGG